MYPVTGGAQTSTKRNNAAMNWALLLPAIFSLVGVAIGASGSLASSYFATRMSSEQARTQRQGELREERKGMLIDYLHAAQAAHDYASKIWDGAPDLPEEPARRQEAARLDSEMWFQQKKLLIVATAPLRSASVAWSELLSTALEVSRPAGSFWDYIEPTQSEFLKAARVDLGITDLGDGQSTDNDSWTRR
jgi:hypothetical protein